MPAGDGVTSQRIALRLRRPRSHELHSFEHCMQVMLHEMSHIAHGNHSAQFYQMMEEITKQYETYLAKARCSTRRACRWWEASIWTVCGTTPSP